MPITVEEFIFFTGTTRENRNKDYKTQDMFKCTSQFGTFLCLFNWQILYKLYTKFVKILIFLNKTNNFLSDFSNFSLLIIEKYKFWRYINKISILNFSIFVFYN